MPQLSQLVMNSALVEIQSHRRLRRLAERFNLSCSEKLRASPSRCCRRCLKPGR